MKQEALEGVSHTHFCDGLYNTVGIMHFWCLLTDEKKFNDQKLFTSSI